MSDNHGQVLFSFSLVFMNADGALGRERYTDRGHARRSWLLPRSSTGLREVCRCVVALDIRRWLACGIGSSCEERL
ncbi:hypothetical protein BDW22DRAFT_1022283 [Trametopsis cervina]|nr:hypothetical protein BDW22DRAFT_1022283 [Trametopsis cervina]